MAAVSLVYESSTLISALDPKARALLDGGLMPDLEG